jgi:hypothetical protein
VRGPGQREHLSPLFIGQRVVHQHNSQPLTMVLDRLQELDSIFRVSLAAHPKVAAKTPLQLALDPVQLPRVLDHSEQHRSKPVAAVRYGVPAHGAEARAG